MISFFDANKKIIFDLIITKVEFKINFQVMRNSQISESVFVLMTTTKDAMF